MDYNALIRDREKNVEEKKEDLGTPFYVRHQELVVGMNHLSKYVSDPINKRDFPCPPGIF